jgi:hypothetical protein
MAAAGLSTYGLIRKLWPKVALVEQILKKSPALGLVGKDTDFGEEVRFVSVGTSPPQGIGPGHGRAKASKSASTSEAFQVSLTTFSGAFSLEGGLYRRYKHTGNKALLVNPMKRESSGLVNQMKNDLSSFIHGNGGGVLGRIASTSTLSSQTITLDKGADRRRIVRGMKLWASTTDGTSGTALIGEVTVASVGGTPTAPTVTIAEASWDTIVGLTTTSYLFRAGCIGTGAGGEGVIDGFESWCPLHTGTPGTFKAVPRNNAPEQLAGSCLSATNRSAKARILEAAQIQADTGQADGRLVYLTSTRNWTDLHTEMSSANALVQQKAPAAPVGKLKIGVEYDAIMITGPAGPIEVVADPWMPDSVERLLDMDTWTLASCGDLINWDDGATPENPMLEDASDAREVRAVGDMALICTNPWANVRVAVTA